MDRTSADFDPVAAVQEYLDSIGCTAKIIHTDATIFTVSDASLAVGAPEAEILKSILLRVNHGESHALALMSGVNRVDAKKLKKLLGSHVSFENPEECVKWSGFHPGGVPPVGYPEQPRTFLDEDLFQYMTQSGQPPALTMRSSLVSPDELLRITHGEKADIKK
jgi:prolyl-tRNA editing enzyme YbaK/EbsC (Cys-tRNA(Pro) deacylase)